MESPDVCEIEARRWQDTFASVRACGMHASLILTDPPYGTTCNSWDEPVDSDEFVDASLKLLGERGVFVSTTAEPYTSSVVRSLGKHFKYCWYWNKRLGTNFLNAKKQPLRVIEPIVVG